MWVERRAGGGQAPAGRAASRRKVRGCRGEEDWKRSNANSEPGQLFGGRKGRAQATGGWTDLRPGDCALRRRHWRRRESAAAHSPVVVVKVVKVDAGEEVVEHLLLLWWRLRLR